MTLQTTTFKGARYIVKFHDPLTWSADDSYEAIEAVKHNAYTYISKQPVPVGVDISNTDFWLLWADPNAQMEELRQLVAGYVEDVDALEITVGQLGNDVESFGNLLPASEFSSENTVKDHIDAIDGILPGNAFSNEDTVKDYIDAVSNGNEELAKYAINELGIAPIGLLSLKSKYLDTAFTGVTPQGICAMSNDKIAIAISQLSSTPNVYGVDFLEINISTSTIVKWCTNEYLNHCNDIAYNQTNHYMYVCDQSKIFVLDITDYQIIDTIDTNCTGIAYDDVSQKMYVYTSGGISEFDYVNKTVGTQLFTYTPSSISSYGGFQPSGLFQGFDVHNGKFYISYSSLNRGCGIVIYDEEYNVESITPIDFNYAVYTETEMQGVAITNDGHMITHGRVRCYQSYAYDLIAFVNNKNDRMYSFINPTYDTNIVYVDENESSDYIGDMFPTTNVKTFCQAVAYSKYYGIPRIGLRTDTRINTETNYLTEDLTIMLANHTLTIDHVIETSGNIVIRGGGTLEITTSEILRNFGFIHLSSIKLNGQGQYIMRNSGILDVYDLTFEEDSSTSIQNSGRGIVTGQASAISALTLTSIGSIAGNVVS